MLTKPPMIGPADMVTPTRMLPTQETVDLKVNNSGGMKVGLNVVRE